jgi:virginiamycin B lyase
MVWYNDHGNQYIGKLNPKTGEVKEWLVPGVTKEEAAGEASGRPVIDAEGNLWFGRVKVDIKSESFTVGRGPIEADGGIWSVRSGPQGDGNPRILEVNRLDPKTGETKRFAGPTRPMRFYDTSVDAQGNLYGASLQFGTVGVLNGKNGEWAFIPTPSPNSGQRRTVLDSQGRFWYSQYFSGHVGMFDPKTWETKEWLLHPYAQPYGIDVDNNGEAWAAGQGAEYLYRVNSKTGEVTPYPKGSMGPYHHTRHLVVDSSTTPVTVWVPHNHMASIARVEPLD